MNARSDRQLLRAFAERRSEAAFAELVRRHIDLVHSAAVRMVNDPDLAKDVAQGVFVALAEDAEKLAEHPFLSGWLHRTARNIAARTVRTDVRRRSREKQAAAMNEHSETDAAWEEIAPHLDAALDELSEPDRDALLLRYFENKPAQEMAAVLGISAEAAQKRVSRAVERLRENFAKRGITAGAAGLAGVISANAMQAAPNGLAAGISDSVAAGTATVTVATNLLAMTTIQKFLVAAAVVLLGGTAIYQVQRRSVESAAASLPPSPSNGPYKPGKISAFTGQLAKPRVAKLSVDRAKELERLKQGWIEVGNSPEKHLEAEALAKESADLLLCGLEMFELMKFLKDRQMTWAPMMTSSAVQDLFATGRAGEARGLLVDLTKTVELSEGRSSDTSFYPEQWSHAAGKTCPEDEFVSFNSALNCKFCAQQALFGRNETLMQTDPEAAVRSTLEALAAKTDSTHSGISLKDLFEEELPPDIDFAKLEALLPADASRN